MSTDSADSADLADVYFRVGVFDPQKPQLHFRKKRTIREIRRIRISRKDADFIPSGAEGQDPHFKKNADFILSERSVDPELAEGSEVDGSESR